MPKVKVSNHNGQIYHHRPQGILYGALQLLFGFKPPKWHPGLVIFILWLLSVVALGILVATGFISTELLTV